MLNEVEFKITDQSGNAVVDFIGESVAVDLLPPMDPYFDASKESSGNVYNNTGEGLEFGYFVTNADKSKTPHTIARFVHKKANINPNDESLIENYSYDVVYEAGMQGGLSAEYTIQTDNKEPDFLENRDKFFTLKFTDSNGDEHSEFFVKASNGSRPGDDFILNFGLSEYDSVFTRPEDNDKNFLAVYDKKMLWRANLYIDEGEGDWNDQHPWIDKNEWNREYTGENTLPLNTAISGEAYLSNLTKSGEGMQSVEILPVTWTGNQNVSGSVAYSIGCHDNPFEYGSKLQDQRHTMEYSIQNNISGYSGGDAASIWNNTTAPHSKNPPYTGSGEWANYIGDIDGITIGSTTYYPYRPGYSSTAGNDNNPGYAKSSGVDCVGLVQRSAAYAGNPYTWWTDIDGYIFTDTNPFDGRNFPKVADGELWKITSKEDEKYDANDIVYYPDLNKIIPGDIIYYSGHVMMVADVKYEPGTRNTTVSQIKIIEATTWEVYFVSKLHSLDRYSGGINNADKNWVIGRLK